MTAGVAFANAKLPDVAFAVSEQQFKAGDAILIDQVLASSPKLGVGDKVIVRGHYLLASASKATIGFCATHASPTTTDDPVSQSQTTNAKSPAGSFELYGEITYAGALHISFYPAAGGEAFGGVYFMAR
jgi:hypothetical protein